MHDDRISKRDFIHGVMDLFGVDASSAIKVNRKLSRVYHLFRDGKEMDVNCSEMFFVFQSISLCRIIRNNPRKVILTLMAYISDGKKSDEVDLLMTFKRAILSACIYEEEEIDTKKTIDLWINRFYEKGRKIIDIQVIQDLLELVPSLEIKFRDDVLDRLSHRNKMVLLEDEERGAHEIIYKSFKYFTLKKVLRKMNHLKCEAFYEWQNLTRQSIQGQILQYRMLYWKVHRALLRWHRQAVITTRYLSLGMVIKVSHQRLVCSRIFAVWKRYVNRCRIIRQTCFERSETAKNISLALTRVQIAVSYYHRRLLFLRWKKVMDVGRKIEHTRKWNNKMKLLKYFGTWKTSILLQRQEVYRNQVHRELFAIQNAHSNQNHEE